MSFNNFRRRMISIPITLIIVVIIFIQSALSPGHYPTIYRELWNTKGGINYEMIVEVSALPAVPVTQALTIKDRKIIKNSILACDNPSEEYPASDCETIKTYYPGSGLYTIDELFDMADFSLNRTREFMRKCSAVSGDLFRDFPNADAMFEMAKTCEADLQPDLQGKEMSLVVFSAVEYEDYYGYPRKITSTILGALDGTSIITVKSFRLIE